MPSVKTSYMYLTKEPTESFHNNNVVIKDISHLYCIPETHSTHSAKVNGKVFNRQSVM